MTDAELAQTLGRRLLLTHTTSIDRGNYAGWTVERIGTRRGLSSSNWQCYLHYARDQQDREEKT